MSDMAPSVGKQHPTTKESFCLAQSSQAGEGDPAVTWQLAAIGIQSQTLER